MSLPVANITSNYSSVLTLSSLVVVQVLAKPVREQLDYPAKH